MAGILVTIGDDANLIHEKMHEAFSNIKDLDQSDKVSEQTFCLSKFFRKNELDYNILQTEDNNIWVVGTVIYRRSVGKQALKEMEKDIERREIEQITDDLDGHFCLVIQKRR